MAGEEPTAPATATAPSINDIPHQPRKKFAPRFDHLPEFRAAPEPAPAPAAARPKMDPLEESLARVAAIKEPRMGPAFVKYSLWAGGAAIAYTYLLGFRSLYVKDRATWMHTFKQRVVIMSPLIAMYITGANLVPMPFRASIEHALGRPAVTLVDMDRVERKVREAQKAAKVSADHKAGEIFADAQLQKQ